MPKYLLTYAALLVMAGGLSTGFSPSAYAGYNNLFEEKLFHVLRQYENLRLKPSPEISDSDENGPESDPGEAQQRWVSSTRARLPKMERAIDKDIRRYISNRQEEDVKDGYRKSPYASVKQTYSRPEILRRDGDRPCNTISIILNR